MLCPFIPFLPCSLGRPQDKSPDYDSLVMLGEAFLTIQVGQGGVHARLASASLLRAPEQPAPLPHHPNQSSVPGPLIRSLTRQRAHSSRRSSWPPRMRPSRCGPPRRSRLRMTMGAHWITTTGRRASTLTGCASAGEGWPDSKEGGSLKWAACSRRAEWAASLCPCCFQPTHAWHCACPAPPLRVCLEQPTVPCSPGGYAPRPSGAAHSARQAAGGGGRALARRGAHGGGWQQWRGRGPSAPG